MGKRKIQRAQTRTNHAQTNEHMKLKLALEIRTGNIGQEPKGLRRVDHCPTIPTHARQH